MAEPIPANASKPTDISQENTSNEPAEKSVNRKAQYALLIIGATLSLVALYFLSRNYYLLFHSMTEVFTIVITFAIFVIAWNSRRTMDNHYLLFIGIAFLFVGGLDLVHTLAYRGMGVFPASYGTNLATQLWIATRYLLSISLLVALLFVRRKFRPSIVFAGYAIFVALLFSSIFWFGNFPTAFNDAEGPGHGLTTFKIASEFLISGIFACAIVLLFRVRREFSKSVLNPVLVALAVAIGAEMSFTLYTDAYGIANMVGHLLIVVSFFLIYRALVETGIKKPYDLLFRNLKQSETNLSKRATELTQVNKQLVLEATERKKAEEALRESEQRWATTIASVGDAVIATDLNGKVTFMNSIAEELTGWTLDEASDQPLSQVFNIVNEKTRIQVENPVAKVLEKGLVTGLANHTVLLRRDGTEVAIDDSGAPIVDKDGKITGVVLVFRDVTERKKFENALVEASREWERTFDSVPDFIAVLDSKHRIIRANKPMARQLNATPEQCIGLLCYSCVHGTSQPPEVCPHALTLKDGLEHTAEVFEPRLGGHFLVSTTPLRDDVGQLIGSVHVARNITHRKEMERKLEEYSKHLEALVEQKTRELRDSERLAAIGQTAGMVGHDIRNPLQAITSDLYLEKLEVASLPDGEAKANLHESITCIEQNLFYINKIVADLQDYARTLNPKKETIDLEKTIEETLTIVSIPKNVQVHVAAEKGFPPLVADSTMTKRVLVNLVQNAVQAMPNGGNLTVAVQGKRNQVLISVEDTGEGITKEAQEKIFKPLFTTKSKGQGFGLAVVKRLVEAQGGTISFKSKVGKGTKFTVGFPK